MGKNSGSMMNSGSGMGGNMNQQKKGNGQRARDGSCENNKGQGKGSGKQNMNENNTMRKNGKVGNSSQAVRVPYHQQYKAEHSDGTQDKGSYRE